MINAFKQIRLTNVNLSGNSGRIEAGASGSFAFTSELNDLNTTLTGSINSTGSSLYNLITGVSGALSQGATNDLSGVSGVLNSKINSVSGYVNDQISGLINNAPGALDTLKELSDALSGDADFAGTLVNSLGAISGRITDVSGDLQSGINTKVSSSTQKQFKILLPIGIETTGISFPGAVFTSAPSVQVTLQGDVAYQSMINGITTSGFDVYFSDYIQESNTYLNVFASNQ